VNITIEVQITLARRLRNTRLQLRWFGWLLRLVGVGYLIWWATDIYLLNGLLFGAFYLLAPELIGVGRHVLGRRFGRIYTYSLTDDGVGIRTAITNLEFSWPAVKSIRERGRSWQVRLPAGGGFTLPKEAFTPSQLADWRAFLTARVATPA
jgi:hypothetical protein